jgi:UDPglucose 6-dehydrogenase
MKVSMIGAGRLGFPVGCAIAGKGHEVAFYDNNRALIEGYKAGRLPTNEELLPQLYEDVKSDITYADSLEEAVTFGEISFIAVQTPHLPEQDGSVRWHGVKANFDNDFVVGVVERVSEILEAITEPKTVVVISTMLPGSMDNDVLPKWKAENHALIYSPSFIAMGTVVADFLHPEFWLVGWGPDRFVGDVVDQGGHGKLHDFYSSLNQSVPIHTMSYSSAEATKVFYNTFITMKLTITNTIMEIADRIDGCDCDDILRALRGANVRITSGAYMRGGMVDGGGCHPRDNIALAWLSAGEGLGYNLFEWMMDTREKQVEYLASIVAANASTSDNTPPYYRQVVILGKAFKPNTHLTYGSPSLLLGEVLKEGGITPLFYDVYTDPALPPRKPSVYVLGVNMPEYLAFPFAEGSTIVDPWGMFDMAPEGCTLISVGRERGR